MDLPVDPSLLASTAFAANGAPNLNGVRSEAAAEAVAREFEGFFISQMLQAMFAGLETPEPFGGGPGEEAFRGLLMEEYGKLVSKSGGIGMSASLKAEIMRLQEIAA